MGFVTVKYKLVPEEVPVLNLKLRGRIFILYNSPEVNNEQNYEGSCFWGSLASAFAAIGDLYVEESVSSIIK